MSGRYLLDTNVIIALFAYDATVIERMRIADEVFIPCIVAGELYYGARKSSRVEQNLERVDAFVTENLVLSCNAETAKWYGDIKADLRKQGRPLPENDIWIAALALQFDLTLVSRDEHFASLGNLNKESW